MSNFKGFRSTFVNRSQFTVLLLVFFMVFTAGIVFPKANYYLPDKSNINLGELVSKTGSISLGAFFIPDKKGRIVQPAMGTVIGDKKLLYLNSGKKIMVIDTETHKILLDIYLSTKVVAIAYSIRIYRSEGQNFFLIIHKVKKKQVISRYDFGMDGPKWTIPFYEIFKFRYYYTNKDFFMKNTPFNIRLIENNTRMLLIGVTIDYKKNVYMNEILKIDVETGRTIMRERYHYRRQVEKDLKIFVNKDNMEFKIIDIKNGNIHMEGKYDDSVIPEGKGRRYMFIGNSEIFFQSGERISGGWDFSVVFCDKGLMFSARNYSGGLFKHGIKDPRWSLFDKETGKIKKIEPAPQGGLEMAIRNTSGEKWPKIVPQMVSQSAFRKSKTHSFWKINSDGSMKLFKIAHSGDEDVIFRYSHRHKKKWIHDGEYMYHLYSPLQKFLGKLKPLERKLFRIKIGEEKSELIFKFSDKAFVSHIEIDSKSYITLTGYDFRRILLELPEGKDVTESKYKEQILRTVSREKNRKKYFNKWMKLNDIKYLTKNLPLEQFPTDHKKIQKYNTWTAWKPSPKYLRIHELLIFTLPTIWGIGENFQDPRDIGVMIALNKDKTAGIAGITLPENKVVFYIPALRFKKITGGRTLWKLLMVNKEDALLVVIPDPENLEFYKVKRPL